MEFFILLIINRMPKMTSDASTNAGKHVTSNMHVRVANKTQNIQSSDLPK